MNRSKGKKSRFRGKVAHNAKKQKQGRASYGYLNLPKGIPIFKEEPDTKIKLDIVPYKITDSKHPDKDLDRKIALPGDLWYKRPFKIHRNIGANNDVVVCRTSFRKRCPICAHIAEEMRKGVDKDELKPLRDSKRNLYVVIPKGHSKYEEIPHIWDISQWLFQNLLTEELEENEDYEIFPDFEEGFTLRIRFVSASIGSGQPFAEASRIDFLERKETYDEEKMLGKIPSLDAVLQLLSFEALQAKFFELEDEEPSDKPQDAEEEEPEEEEPEEEEPEEEEPEEEEPEEEEPEEEEEPRKAPSKRTRPKEKNEPTEKKKDRCPHNHKFGIDTEDFDECDTCDLWEECIDVKEG